MTEETQMHAPDDPDVAALLRRVGARPVAPAQLMGEMRSAVEAEWRATVAARQRRRQLTGWAMAASVAVAAFGVWLARPLLLQQSVAVASLARVVGGVEQNRGDGRWTPVATSVALSSGTQLRTASDGRASVQLDNGVELRLDSRTLVALNDTDHAALAKGAVYVDSGYPPGTPGPAFELDTPAGSVAHVGTQYEARIADGNLQLAVREGRVRLSGKSGDVVGDAGERLTVRNGQVTRAALPPNAAEWNWVAEVTPPFVIEGRSVESFLVWAARQTGRTIVYTSPDAAQLARSVTLRGTVEGLTPDAAVTAVLSTTSLRPEIGTEHIRIETAQP